MAEALRFVCGNCGRAIEAWSDGNPYYLDEEGRKKYAYHPDHERLALCIGNDSPHLCLACGWQFKVDSRAPRADCPRCGAGDIVHTWEPTLSLLQVRRFRRGHGLSVHLVIRTIVNGGARWR